MIAWALMAVVVGAAIYAFLWLRYRFRHPEAPDRVAGDPGQSRGRSGCPRAVEAAQPALSSGLGCTSTSRTTNSPRSCGISRLSDHDRLRHSAGLDTHRQSRA